MLRTLPRIRSILLALLFAFGFAGYVQRTSVATAAGRMMPELGLTQIQVGWLFTAFLLTYSVFQIPGALVGRRLGPRWTLTLVGISTALASLLTVAAPSFASGAALLVALIVARALLGIAQAALFPVAAGAIERWFPVRAWGLGIGWLVAGLWTGAACTPPLVATLMERFGWRWALVAATIPSLLLVAIWHWFARDTPAEHFAVGPAELAELASNPAAEGTTTVGWRAVVAMVRDGDLLRLTLSYLVMNYVFYLVTFWSFLYLVQSRHLSALESGWLAALPFVTAGTAAALGGRLADALRAKLGARWGARVLPLVSLPVAAAFLFLTVRIASPYWAVAALCLAFACLEVNEGNYWSTAMRLVPRESMAATAFLNTGGNLGGVLATPIIAALSGDGGWAIVFATGAVTALVAAALWLTIDTDRTAAGGTP